MKYVVTSEWIGFDEYDRYEQERIWSVKKNEEALFFKLIENDMDNFGDFVSSHSTRKLARAALTTEYPFEESFSKWLVNLNAKFKRHKEMLKSKRKWSEIVESLGEFSGASLSSMMLLDGKIIPNISEEEATRMEATHGLEEIRRLSHLEDRFNKANK